MLDPLVRIVDDDESVRISLVFLAELAGFNAVGYESAEAFDGKDDAERPGCLVLDIRLPGLSGLELQRKLVREGSDLPILFLTGHGDVSMAVEALKRGAADFVEKPMEPEKFQHAVRRLIAWNVRVREGKERLRKIEQRFECLTPKEREVLELVSANLTIKETAARLGISLETVKKHRSSLFQKLGVKTPLEVHALVSSLTLFNSDSDGIVFQGHLSKETNP